MGFDIRTLVGMNQEGMTQWIRTLVADPAQTAAVTTAVQTFIDDDLYGDATHFDRAEVLRVGEYLLAHGVPLTQSISSRSLERYRRSLGAEFPEDMALPKPLVRAGQAGFAKWARLLFSVQPEEFKTRANQALASSFDVVDTYLRTSGKDPKQAVVKIVVMGPSAEINLPAILARYGQVRLVGPDRAAMEALCQGLPQADRKRVAISVEDATGGAVVRAYRDTAAIIRDSQHLPEAVLRLTQYLTNAEAHIPVLDRGAPADVVISCRAVNHLVHNLDRVVTDQLNRKFQIDEDKAEFIAELWNVFQGATTSFKDKLLGTHLAALIDHAQRGGAVVFTAHTFALDVIQDGAEQETREGDSNPFTTYMGIGVMSWADVFAPQVSVSSQPLWAWVVNIEKTETGRIGTFAHAEALVLTPPSAAESLEPAPVEPDSTPGTNPDAPLNLRDI